MDTAIIVETFVVVVTGGLGSIGGAFAAALLIGLVHALSIQIFPQATLVLVFLTMAVVLVLRPQGLAPGRLAVVHAVREPVQVFGGLQLGRAMNTGLAVALVAACAAAWWGGPYWQTLALDTLVFEGWCIGAQPEPAAALDRPCNTRERNEDLDGTWRRYVNTALAGPYRALFARVDLMVFLAAPSFETVVDWRCEQEAALLAARPDAPRAMDRHAIEAFCALYERTTRALLRGMPSRADVVVALDAQRRCMHLDLRGRA
jgi:hypothetical protein